MEHFALLFSVTLPLLVSMLFLVPKWRSFLRIASPWSAAPAFLLSIFGSVSTHDEISWMLLGTALGLDATAKVFLFFTSLLWGLAGIYANSYLPVDSKINKFFLSYLLAMCGNLGLILSQDIVSFYFFFGLMSLSSYGLIVHERTGFAYFAGLVYVSLVILGEVLIFSGMVLTTKGVANLLFQDFTALVSSDARGSVIIGLLFIGFSIKAGVLPLHVWLPLAHPVAPTPASAILSGAMIKAGLLGWLRFLPLGEAAFPFWGAVMIILGLLGAYYAVIVGIVQERAKTVLAYSSISQMGLMTAAVGTGLMVPVIWPYLWTALMIFAAHHAIAKGALFLSIGVARSKWKILWTAAFVLPAFALVGAPFTSGALAKALLKWTFKQNLLSSPVFETVIFFIGASAIGTFLLLSRFCWIAWISYPMRPVSAKAGIVVPWSLLVVASLLLPLFSLLLGLVLPKGVLLLNFAVADLTPLLIGGALVFAAINWKWKIPFTIPEGDILFFYTKAGKFIHSTLSSAIAVFNSSVSGIHQRQLDFFTYDMTPLVGIEHAFGIWKIFGIAFLSLAMMILFLFAAI